jgi:pimeloyl-ACP methyl ester carboxylesterase
MVLEDPDDKEKMDALGKEYANPSDPVDLWYLLKNGKLRKPVFRLKITNLGDQDLHVSTLFLTCDYGISNKYMTKMELPKGKPIHLTSDGNEKNFIANVADEYLSWGVNEVTDFIKIYVSTDPNLNTTPFNQKELELDTKRGATDRGLEPSTKGLPNLHDWTSKIIAVKTHRPLDETPIEPGREANIPGLSIQAPTGFSAKVSLTSLGPATRSLNTPLPPAFWNYPQSHVMPLTRGLDRTDGLEMLEIIGAQGREQITADNPIEIRLQQPLQAQESVVPIGYDPESGLFFPVGLTDEEGRVLIQQLPDDTPTGQRSLGGSIKLFFQKIIGQRIGMEGELYKLRRVTVAPDEELTYLDEGLEAIEQAVQADNCTHVALFIHGIIGDTTVMPKVLRRVQCAGGGSMIDRYQVVLTFDYENLDTSIDDIARELKKRLVKAGLGNGHGKTFHIFAHSMGGLVSRWFIEKEGGKEMVSRLFTFGTPHNGTPYSNISELVTMAVTYAVNGSAILQPWLLPLMLAGKLLKKTQHTLVQMKPGGELLSRLNDGTAPPIPYTIFVGNTQLIDPEKDAKIKGLLRRILARFKNRPHYLLLDALLFGKPNDIAVSAESQQAVGSDGAPLVVASDHLCYFENASSLKALEGKLNELKIC